MSTTISSRFLARAQKAKCWKSKYPSFVPARRVSQHSGRNITTYILDTPTSACLGVHLKYGASV